MTFSKEEVFGIITSKPNGNIEESNFKKKFPELYQEIINISFPEEFKWTQKLFHFFHDDLELNLGLCPVCGKRCKFRNFNLGYLNHCSYKCAQIDENTQEKIQQTCQKRYGCKNPKQNEKVKRKSEQTCQKRYGCKNPMQSKEIRERAEHTNEEKYGCKNVFQNEEIKEKIRQTNQEKWGVDNYTQTLDFAKYHRKRIEYDGITFDSSWEVKLYKFCKEHNIPCEYQPDITLQYMFQDKLHYYHPDFFNKW